MQEKPKAPVGIKYALSVSQSVLFTDLSLQGNLRNYFKRTMDIDYGPIYISVDAGAISWNYDSDNLFLKKMNAREDTQLSIIRFIDTMNRTSRLLNSVSMVLSHSSRRLNVPQDLIQDLETYWETYKLHMTSLFTFWNIENLLIQELKKRMHEHKDDVNKIFNTIFQPNEANAFVWEKWHLKRVVDRFTKKELLKEAMQNHLRTFSFILTPFNLGEFPDINQQLKRVEEVKDLQQSLLPEKYLIPLQLNLPDELKVWGNLAQQMTFWRTERLDILSLCDSRMKELYQQTADFLKITKEHLFSMTSREILESLQHQKVVISIEESQRRRNAFCLVLYNGIIDFYTPTLKENNRQEILKVGETINGTCVSQGNVKGKVRILDDPERFEELRPGEILVATMTRPEMGVALEKAAAFVTNQGGLLCHAAILSREMKKPCVVGTNNATQILKDGTFIEVNATKGIIKVLEIL